MVNVGVDSEHYVVVGIKCGYDELEGFFKTKLNLGEYDDVEDHLECVESSYDADVGDFAYIADGMNGEYAVLGKVIRKKTKNMRDST
jgi:hypothetical protein